MRERDFQSKFTKWAQHRFSGSACFELKVCDRRLPFDAVQEHQEFALYQAKHANVVFKIPDGGWQNPFDCFRLEGCNAYVVVLFNRNDKGEFYRGYREFFLIDIDVWLEEKKTSISKSLNQTRARQIGTPRQFSSIG